VAFQLQWTRAADKMYRALTAQAAVISESQEKTQRSKTSKQEGIFKQLCKRLKLLRENPRHPSLQTHEFSSLKHPYTRDGKVFEAYAQQNTPAAYRVFWCYGPKKDRITIIDITAHP
jgi:hypothetical protein